MTDSTPNDDGPGARDEVEHTAEPSEGERDDSLPEGADTAADQD